MTVPPKSMEDGVDGVVNGRHAQGDVVEDYNGKQGRAQIQSREIFVNILVNLNSKSVRVDCWQVNSEENIQ